MRENLVAPILIGCLACAAAAQTTPTSLTKTKTYPATTFGLTGGGAGGITFDAVGQKLFINNINPPEIWSVTVVRNASGKISSFTNPTLTAKGQTTAGAFFDGGLSINSIGTLFATGWGSGTYPLDQYSTTTKAQAFDDMATIGVSGATAGGGAIVAGITGVERLLITDYYNGGIYEIPLTLKPNLTYTLGTAKLYMKTDWGFESLASVVTGPFGGGKGIVVMDYRNSAMLLFATDPVTRDPYLDARGNPMWIPVITGLSSAEGVAFDPLTGDLFISQYSSTSDTLLQFSGEITSNDVPFGDFVKFAPGCPNKNGSVPTIDTLGAPLRAGFPLTILLARAAKSQNTSFLVFGFGNTGNLGGFLFPGTTCRAHVNPQLSVPMATSNSGIASFNVTIPALALGLDLFMQQWALSPGANPLNLAVSDAAVSRISN